MTEGRFYSVSPTSVSMYTTVTYEAVLQIPWTHSAPIFHRLPIYSSADQEMIKASH